MPVDDLPPGDFTSLLVGDHWPTATSLEVLSASIKKRSGFASEFDRYAHLLHQISDHTLTQQEGITADEARENFRIGQDNAWRIADVNATKSRSYNVAHQQVVEFRTELRELAVEGNNRIDEVIKSQFSLDKKIARIVEIIKEIRTRASSKAASRSSDIYSEIQTVLTIQGIDQPARVFAAENGTNVAINSSTEPDDLKKEVSNKLEQGNNPGNLTPRTLDQGASLYGPVTNDQGAPPPNPLITNEGSAPPPVAAQSAPLGSAVANDQGGAPEGVHPGAATTPSTPPARGVSNDQGARPPRPVTTQGAPAAGAVTNDQGAQPASPPTPAPPTPSLTTTDLSSTPSLTAPTAPAPSAIPNMDNPGPSASPTSGSPVDLNLSPDDLAQSFNTGNQTAAPVSTSAEVISGAAANPFHTAPPTFTAPLADTAAPATPVFETAHAAPAPTAEFSQILHAPTELAQPVIAAAPAAPTMAVPPVTPGPIAMPSSTPPSGLLGYGADLRPTTTAAVTPTVTPAAPSSAPVTAASGSSPTGQPTVVRHQPSPAAAQTTSAAGLTERAFAATATGAAAGATGARAQAEARLRRLLDVVARQQPELRWAIGDREDGNTVVVTDLAGGWIPPHIEIPTGLRLLQPGTGRKELAALLGETTLRATYAPGQFLGRDHERVQMSIRARDTAAVAELGWDLSEATRWRDGLPRLAHTLARAVSAKTGYLDSEVDMLRECLSVVAGSVLKQYPETVNTAQVGNWQLLATIEALINGEKTLANYHFAWFQAQARTREGNR